MAAGFLSDAAKQALVEAVRAVEGRSRAEVVVVVHPASADYRDAVFAGGACAAFATLAFLLFSPWGFGLVWFLVDPAIAGLAAALAVRRSPALIRLLTTAGARRKAVRDAARVAFVDRGISETRDRTGLLLYVSLLEREAEVVPDRGIPAAVDAAAWSAGVAALAAAVRAGADGVRTAEHLRGLGTLLAEAMPVGPDDVNELPDAVVMS